MKKTKQNKSCLLLGMPEALVMLGVLLVVIFGIITANVCAPAEEVPEITLETVSENPVRQEILSSALSLPIPLGEGITLTGLFAADAMFPEDGSNTYTENLLCAVLQNGSGRTLEYMTFSLQNGEEKYEFSVTTLPPESDIYLFEKNAAEAPEQITELTAEVPVQLFFSEEPELMEEQLEITVLNGTIDIKNITDAPIDREIQVYYKNTENLVYFGGITYFLRVPAGLKPGETYSGYAANASTERTEVMFVKYGK